jgi:predicted DNA-binding mobile mystery protein A
MFINGYNLFHIISIYGYAIFKAVVMKEHEVIMREQFRLLRLQQLDRGLHSLESANIAPRPTGGWLASVREALGLTLEQVAQRLGTGRPNVLRFERYEASERITLRNLRRVAEAMDCQLVYALTPKSGSFVELSEKPVRDRALRDVESVVHTMALEDQEPENAKQLIENEALRRLNRKRR